MKKILIALVLSLLLIAGLSTIAFADNGPHGNFTATTDACAGCHRAHSARSGTNDLLRVPVSELCLSCHADGQGASTDVKNGIYTTNANTGTHAEGTSGAGLFGGGFTNALMTTTWNGSTQGGTQITAQTSRVTTSSHTIGSGQTVWGSDANNSTAASMDLECTSCHDPHGKAGYTNTTGGTPAAGLANACDPALVGTYPCTVKTASYRILRWQPEGSNGFSAPGSVNWSGGAFPSNGTTTGWTVPDNFAADSGEWYTLGTTRRIAANDYDAGASMTYVYGLTATDTGSVAMDYKPAVIGISFFCAQCHDRYFNNTRLRNNTDESAYCGLPAQTGYAAPVDATSISTVDATYCKPYYSTTAPARWLWADSRPSGDDTYMYRHNSGDVRGSVDGAVVQSATAFSAIGRTCLACHVAHGSAAQADSNALDGVDAGSIVDVAKLSTNIGGSLHGGSVLLRMDGRTVCIRCHASAVNLVTTTP